MPDASPISDPMYRFTSLGRRLDPAWPTNLAVLVLMPVVGLAAMALAPILPGLAGTGRLLAGASGAGVVLGVWALGRELAPDDQAAAFVGMALGVGALATLPGASLVLLFATLMVVRVVNRSVGLPARTLDGIAVLALAAWAMASTGALGVGLITAGAFALDATLAEPNRRQWGFAALALAMTGILATQTAAGAGPADVTGAVDGQGALLPPLRATITAGVAALLFLRVLARTRRLDSVADATGTPLDPARVRWAMAVGLLMGVQAMVTGTGGWSAASLVWAAVAGVAITGSARLGRIPAGR